MNTPMRGEGRLRAEGDGTSTAVTAAWLDDGVLLDHRHWRCDSAEMAWQAQQHLFVLTESGGTGSTEVRIAGDPRYVGQDRPGSLSFVPAGAERECRYRATDLTYTAIWIDPAALERRGLPPGRRAEPMLNGSDPLTALNLTELRRALVGGLPPDDLYVSHVAAMLLLRRSPAGPPQRRMPGRQPLARPVLRRVLDYIDAHLGTRLPLRGLAGVAGMEPDRFARGFKLATGSAPHAFVTQRRIAQAQALLAGTEREAGEIGLDLGFATASHFATAFRRHVGCSPSTWRHAHRC